MEKEQSEKGSPAYIGNRPRPPASLFDIRRNPTNRRPRVCGSAASPQLSSRSHNSFDRRTVRFRLAGYNGSHRTCWSLRARLFNVVFLSSFRGQILLFLVVESCDGARVLREFARRLLVSLVHGGRCSPAGSRAMRFSWMFVATMLLVLVSEARCKRKFDGDFEFAEEVSSIIVIYDCTTFLGCPCRATTATG